MATQQKTDEQQQLELAKSVAFFRDNMPAMIELAHLQAKLAHARYVSLRHTGFTDEQALQLCKESINL